MKISEKIAYHVSKWALKDINDLIEQLLIVSFDKSYDEAKSLQEESWARNYWNTNIIYPQEF